MKHKELLFIFIAYFAYSECITSRKIPDHLLDCYRNGSIVLSTPNKLQYIVELLSQVERNHTNANIRTISTSLLHFLKLDGIERGPNIVESENVIPYRASAFQYAKFSFLMDMLIPSQTPWKLSDELSLNTICGTHFAISYTVDPWQRGDEEVVCPMKMPKDRNTRSIRKNIHQYAATKSRCPIEKGIMKTEWGDIAFGTILTGIAAGLERQDVKSSQLLKAMKKYYKDEETDIDDEFNTESKVEFEADVTNTLENSDPIVSNLLVATISGDLAELAIRQGPHARGDTSKYVFGPPGRWNDSLLPRDFYLLGATPIQWEMTDAEILGAIDGLIIGENIKSWVEFRNNVRMSQIVEMYYSNYGVPFGDGMRACNRKQNFLKVKNSFDLNQQTLAIVNLLWLKLANVYMEPKAIEEVSRAAVAAFEEYWPKLLEGLPGCNVDGDANQMDITLVTDQTWNKYQTEQFVSFLTEKLDVSNFGSTLGLLHGSTGEWISPPSNSTIELHENIANSSNVWVARLDLPNALTTIVRRLENETATPNDALVAFPRVIIIAAPSSRWSQIELDKAKMILDSIRTNYADVYFLYLTPDKEGVEALGKGLFEFSDEHIETSETNVKKVVEMIRSNFVEKIVPMRIVVPQCDRYNFLNQYEDYISVGQKIVYRIHPKRLRVVDTVKVYFQGVDQGEISVCISRQYSEDAADSCKIISENKDARFHLDDPCKGKEMCDPVYFIVRARSTKVNCADKSCRYPNHIRYLIRHTGLGCNPSNNSASNQNLTSNKNIYIAILSLLYLLLLNKLVDDNN